MYYARGRGCTPCAVRGRRRRRWRRKPKGRTREKDTAKDEGGVCVWRVWRPLRRAGGGCQATPFSPHILTPPSTNPQNPLVRSPFASWRTLSSVLCRSLARFSFLSFRLPCFYPTRCLTSTAYCLSIATLILIRWEPLGSMYCFRDNSLITVYNIWNQISIRKLMYNMILFLL